MSQVRHTRAGFWRVWLDQSDVVRAWLVDERWTHVLWDALALAGPREASAWWAWLNEPGGTARALATNKELLDALEEAAGEALGVCAVGRFQCMAVGERVQSL